MREASAAILGGFVRLHGPAERVKTLKWARARTKKGRPAAARHAGALALVALVQLAPYDVPAWLPEARAPLRRAALSLPRPRMPPRPIPSRL